MAILRNKLIKDYTMIPNWVIYSKEISNNAFRVLVYLYSKPDNWNVRQVNIAKDLGVGRTTISSWIKDLKKSNAIDVLRVGSGYEYHLKTDNCSVQDVGVQDVGVQDVGVQDVGVQDVGVQYHEQHNKTNTTNTNITNTDINKYMSVLKEVFKKYYPKINQRFISKKVKEKLIIQLKNYTFEDILLGFENYLKEHKSKGTEITFIKSTHIFIQDEMFNDYKLEEIDTKPSNANYVPVDDLVNGVK